ncbi:uncharacterized protein LOC119079808 [Bradysia coprophila]|uniref:uncharacterized protein LOC119079808 n=1 Tax=Bradysia coprophila TaxID=38358 RepID=UPI00187DAEBB|nr:uncharacterized protein LOC119079808 [Bradysia coprophila]
MQSIVVIPNLPNSTMNSNAKYSIKLNTILSGVYSLTCRYDNVEVELFFTKDESSKTQMDYVYFNRVQAKDGKWTTFLNELFQDQCRNQFQSNLRVYGCNIRADNYESHHDSIIKHCLQKCYKTFVSGIRVEDKPLDTSSTSSDQNDQNLSMANSPNVICETMMSAFENHLKSFKFDYTKIHSIICQKDDIKVELALTENPSPDDIFARTYVNRVREPDCKWAICLKHLWTKEFPNDSNLSRHPVYIMAITYNERTVEEEVVQNCIERCLINIKNDLPS